MKGDGEGMGGGRGRGEGLMRRNIGRSEGMEGVEVKIDNVVHPVNREGPYRTKQNVFLPRVVILIHYL